MKDLYLVGLGISPKEHLTIEAQNVLRRCRVILHIDEDARLLRRMNPNVVDIGHLYWTGDDRDLVYARIRDRVLAEMEQGKGVALVTYGHPLLFDDVMHALLRYCKRRKLDAQVIAGISCLDTLAVDLGVDYGDGAQIYDCTDLVLNRQRLNKWAHALLLQVGEYDFGKTSNALDTAVPNRYSTLVKYLRKFYPSSHPLVIVYSDDGKRRRFFKLHLKDLDKHRLKIEPGMTMYVAPIPS